MSGIYFRTWLILIYTYNLLIWFHSLYTNWLKCQKNCHKIIDNFIFKTISTVYNLINNTYINHILIRYISLYIYSMINNPILNK